jgi:hypothetical protein
MEGYTIGGACNRLKEEKGKRSTDDNKEMYEKIISELSEISGLLGP